MTSKQRKAFTLIELLVVISIIAMLMAVLMPALGKAREQAKKTVCATHYKQQALGIILYSENNNSEVPMDRPDTIGNWAWDISFWTTNMISQFAGFDDREIWFCPSNKQSDPDDGRYWQYLWRLAEIDHDVLPIKPEDKLTEGQQKSYFRVLPSVYTFQRYSGDVPYMPKYIGVRNPNDTTGYEAQWISRISRVRRASEWPMAMDAVVSETNSTDNFMEVPGGMLTAAGLYDRSNHLSKRKFDNGLYEPEGANIAFTDGHVEWRKFDDMKFQFNWGQDFWW
jgi:prepilin-type N-terminal cleavage/methylation domain-containing protein/prepilin-type processing-associated H-X9-DG protein